eukprot:Nk52_evm17s2449 gene=Nk52_evmTU17s2449
MGNAPSNGQQQPVDGESHNKQKQAPSSKNNSPASKGNKKKKSSPPALSSSSPASRPKVIEVKPFEGNVDLKQVDQKVAQKKAVVSAVLNQSTGTNLSRQQLDHISQSTYQLQSRLNVNGSVLSGLGGGGGGVGAGVNGAGGGLAGSYECYGEDESPVYTTFQGPDGTLYTTFVDESTSERFYFDFEKNAIVKFPEEWISKGFAKELVQFSTGGGGGGGNDAVNSSNGRQVSSYQVQQEEMYGQQERTGKFEHPDGRIFATYVVEVPRNIMYFYDQDRQDWVRLPLVWEREIPEIGAMITQIKAVLPEWESEDDILLTLRDNDYIIESAIEAKFTELASGGLMLPSGDGTGDGNYGLEGGSTLKEIRKLREQISVLEERQENLIEENLELKERALNSIGGVEGQRKTTGGKRKANLIERRSSSISAGLSGAGNSGSSKELSRYKSKCEQYEKEIEGLKEKIKYLQQDITSLKKGGSEGALKSNSREMDLTKEVTSLKGAVAAKDQKLARVEDELMAFKRKAAIAEVGSESIERSLKMVCDFKKDVKTFKMDINKLKLETAKSLSSIIPIIRKLNSAVHYVKIRIAENDKLVEEMRVKYQAEVHQAKILYNKVQELKGNIRVFCRCRPDMDTNELIHSFPSLTTVEALDPQGNSRSFDFEKVFPPNSTQVEIYTEVEGIIKSCTDGYNVVIMAYGQTGTGKTHTMIGTPQDPGVNVRALKSLFEITRNRSEVNFEISVSMLEIYNEQIFDLLQDPSEANLKRKLDVKMGPRGNYVPGLLEEEVVSEKSVMSVMEKAMKNRTIASTKMNSVSSRSHLIMIVTVLGKNRLSKETTVGKLTLVDLAGSERINKSGASGKQLMEAAAINKSLSTLGQVFTAIRSGSVHVPYRNSKLTYLLQSSLGGDSKAAMFINISPLRRDKTESYSTLQFGKSIRRVEMGIAKKNVMR